MEESKYKEKLVGLIKREVFSSSNSRFLKQMDEDLENLNKGIGVENSTLKEDETYGYRILLLTYKTKKKDIFANIFSQKRVKQSEKFNIVIEVLSQQIERIYQNDIFKNNNTEKMNEKDKIYFDKICQYTTKKFLYPNVYKNENEEKKPNVPRYLVLRIKGMNTGQFIINKKHKKLKMSYEYDIILKTILSNTTLIQNALRDKMFKNIDRKIDYICAIILNKIDETYERIEDNIKRKQNTKIEMKKNESKYNSKGIDYSKKTNKTKLDKFKDFL